MALGTMLRRRFGFRFGSTALMTVALCVCGAGLFGPAADAEEAAAAAAGDTPIGPGGRNKPGFVYDSGRKVFVLFGGFGKRGEGTKGDTWEWDGKGWTRVATGGPSARGAMGMVYDSHRRKVVLFGGAGLGGPLGDTWEWDGREWKPTPVVVGSAPPARAGMQMVYDSRRRVVVGFGGFDQAARQPLGETWEWSASGGRESRWREVRGAAAGPVPRTNHFLVYDSRRAKTVVFGGNRSGAPPAEDGLLDDTWEWDGRQWSQAAAGGGARVPARRDHHGMAYDQSRGRVVVFGGWNGKYLGDTWEWDGARWAEAGGSGAAASGDGPSARGGIPSLAYDPHQKRVVLFGGWDATGPVSDLWAWDGRKWQQLTGSR